MILFHIFENIGAAVGILPLTGIPLPFISQGGSSLISNLIGVGLVLSMSYQNSLNQEKPQNAILLISKGESYKLRLFRYTNKRKIVLESGNKVAISIDKKEIGCYNNT